MHSLEPRHPEFLARLIRQAEKDPTYHFIPFAELTALNSALTSRIGAVLKERPVDERVPLLHLFGLALEGSALELAIAAVEKFQGPLDAAGLGQLYRRIGVKSPQEILGVDGYAASPAACILQGG